MNKCFCDGEKIRNEILRILKAKKISFQHLTHQETISQNVSKEIGVAMHETIKSLIMRGKKTQKNYLICLLGHQKVNMHALASLVGEPCELEKIKALKEQFGLDVGGVCPFGDLLAIPEIYFDIGIKNCNNVVFGCGLPNESIQMKLEDLISLIHPKFANIAII